MDDIELGTAGSSLDSFLKSEGIEAETNMRAAKRVFSELLSRELDRQQMSKAELARRMGVARVQVYRLLDPDNVGLTIDTMHRAAQALGRKLVLSLD